MAILRSRTLASQVQAINSPAVQRALQDWEQRVIAAREAGRLAGLEEAKVRIGEADKRAASADARCEEKQKVRHAELLARFEPVLTSLAGAVTRCEPLEKQLVQEAEGQSVRLALGIAAVVLRKTIEIDPNWVAAVVKGALTRICDRRTVSIRLHPQDADTLRERVQELASSIPGLGQLDIVGDAQLVRGSCTLVSQGTRLDASVAGCWQRLATQLLEQTPMSDCSQSTASTAVVKAGGATP